MAFYLLLGKLQRVYTGALAPHPQPANIHENCFDRSFE